MNTGEKIKLLRKELGYSAEYIAEQIGVSPSTIYRYENNEIASMKIDKLKAIADLLHTNASNLLGWSSDNTIKDVEIVLLTDFRQLNEEGQEKVSEYVRDLLASGRYIKNHKTGLVEKEA